MGRRITRLARSLLVVLMSLAILGNNERLMTLADDASSYDLTSMIKKAEPEKAIEASPPSEPVSGRKTIDFLASSNSPTKEDAENDECKLHIESDLSKAGDESVYAYGGNGFSYSIGCSVDDHKSKIGDKYYVIDMIVYGPNTRVAKAWREQFSMSNLVSRSLSLERSLSFRWLGTNSIVCSITKYNNQMNKFTKICQKTINVNVTEKSPASAPSVGHYQSPFSAYKLQKDSNYNPNSLFRLLFSSTTGYHNQNTNKINRSFMGSRQDNQLKQRQVSNEKKPFGVKLSLLDQTSDDLNLLEHDFTTPTPKSTTTMDAKMREKDKIEWFNKFKESKFMAKSLDNLNARAMQFKGSAENSKTGGSSNGTVSKLLKSTERSDPRSGRAQMLQPLPVIFIFLVVFSVSIATIIYLTYHQNKEDSSKIPVMSHDPDDSIDRSNSSMSKNPSSSSGKHADDQVSHNSSSASSSPTVEPASASSTSHDSRSENSSSCLSGPDECTKLKMDDFDIDDIEHHQHDQIDYERKQKYLSSK